MRSLRAAAALTLGLAVTWSTPTPASCQAWIRNEIRVAAIRDSLKEIKNSLTDSKIARRLTTQTSAAFRSSSDWHFAVEAYVARKRELLVRADELDGELDRALAGNQFGGEEASRRATEVARGKGEVLKADFELYMRLPVIAAGSHGQAAQAAMRLLAQTGEYTVVRTFFQRRIQGPESRPIVVPFVREE